MDNKDNTINDETVEEKTEETPFEEINENVATVFEEQKYDCEPVDENKCFKCGEVLLPDSQYCLNCGMKVEGNKKIKKKNIVLVFVAVLGAIALLIFFTSYVKHQNYLKSPEYKYLTAVDKIENEDYVGAAELLKETDVSDSKELLKMCNRMILHDYVTENGVDFNDMKAIKCSDLPREVYLCAGQNDELVFYAHVTAGTLNNSRDKFDNELELHIPATGDEGTFSIKYESEIYVPVLFTEINTGGAKIGNGTYLISEFNENSYLNVTNYSKNSGIVDDLGIVSVLAEKVFDYFENAQIGICLEDIGFIAFK